MVGWLSVGMVDLFTGEKFEQGASVVVGWWAVKHNGWPVGSRPPLAVQKRMCPTLYTSCSEKACTAHDVHCETPATQGPAWEQ